MKSSRGTVGAFLIKSALLGVLTLSGSGISAQDKED
jgi:hypothetical protein